MKGDVKFINGSLYYEGDNGQYYLIKIGIPASGGISKNTVNNLITQSGAGTQLGVQITFDGNLTLTAAVTGGTPASFLWSLKSDILSLFGWQNLVFDPGDPLTNPTVLMAIPPTSDSLGTVCCEVTDTLGRKAFGYFTLLIPTTI